MIKVLALFSLLFSQLLLATTSQSDEVLQYARIEYSPIQNVAERLLKEIYTRANISMEIVELPAKRASHETKSGNRDGEIMRILSYGVDKSNLYRIPIPLGYVSTVIYVRDGEEHVSLNNLADLHIGVVKGVRHTNEYVQNMPDVDAQSDVNKLLHLVNNGRLDAAVVAGINGRYEVAANPDLDLVPLSEVKHQECFHYINLKHVEAIEKIETIMKEMDSSGELKSLWNQYVDEMLSLQNEK